MNTVEVTGVTAIGEEPRSRFQSESEESEYSISDSVHYPMSEFGDEDDCCSLSNHSDDDLKTEPAEESGNSKLDLGPEKREEDELEKVEEDRAIMTICSRKLASINYGPYRIFFDMEVDGNFIGRIIIKLGNKEVKCRKTIDKLCTGKLGNRRGLTRHYSGTRIHRATTDQFIEGGVLKPLIPEQSVSIYKEKETTNPEYYDNYIMVARKNNNDIYCGARFFITTTTRVKHCDPDLFPVGCVVSGSDLIDSLAALPRDENGFFLSTVTIAHCGSIKQTEAEQWPRGRIEKQSRFGKNSLLSKIYSRSISRTQNGVIISSCKPDMEEEENQTENVETNIEENPASDSSQPCCSSSNC